MLREVGDLEVVAALTASRIMTADLGHHGRLAEGSAVGDGVSDRRRDGDATTGAARGSVWCEC